MSKYEDNLRRIEQVFGDYAVMQDKEISVADVIKEAEEIALSKRGKFPTTASVIRDGKRIIDNS